MSKPETHFYEFGAFRLNVFERILLHEGRTVPLPKMAFETLLALVEQNGHVVGKEDLMRRLWPDTFVEENNLTHYISFLRKVLSNGVDGRRIIETVPKRGYRFVADVRELRGEDAEMMFTERVRAHLVIKEEIEETDGEAQTVSDTTTAVAPQETRALPQTALARRGLRPTIKLVSALVVLVVLAFVASVFISRRAAQRDTATRAPLPLEVRSIAILPFKSLEAEGDDDYLRLGLADALITKLGQIKQISIRPASAIQKYAGGGRDPVSIGRELNVDAVLDGQIQGSGAHRRVTVQLVSVRDGTPLWTETFDDQQTDIATAQDKIAACVASGLTQSLSEQEQTLLRKHSTENSAAYDAYLRGRYFWNKRTPQDMREAVRYFRQAIKLDPNYAQAYAGLADAYLLGGFALEDSNESLTSKDIARKALALDNTLAEAHTSLAYYLSAVDWDWAAAEAEFQRAIELNPNYATAHHWYAYHLASLGRFYEASTEIKRAREIDPNSLSINTDVGHIYYLWGYTSEAIGLYRKVLEIEPNFADAHMRLGEAYAQQKMFPEALAEFQKAGAKGSNMSEGLGYAYAAAGQRAQAQQILHELEEKENKGDRRYEYGIACIYAALGDQNQAWTWLQTAYKYRSGNLALLKVDPRLESLRADPRFTDLLRRVHLAS